LVAEGKLENICDVTDSITGQFLRAQHESTGDRS
jgi:excinuclease UvrABC ATPase subunit